MHRRLALLLTAFAAAFAGLLVAPPAQAVDGWSVNITTTRALSHGDKMPTSISKPRQYWRPHFTVKATVTCPAGESVGVYFSPVSGNQDPTYTSDPPVCTGTPQTFSVLPVGTKGNIAVTVSIYQGSYWSSATPMATDTQVVRVVAVTTAR